MAVQQAQTNSDSSAAPDVARGKFPFPLSAVATESPYLRWLRNHSNYMATGGFLDYLRAVGVLVRGIVVNFLTVVPYLLLVAIVLAFAHHWMLAHPFRLTLVVLAFAAVWVLIFPITTPIFKIVAYRRSVETGSESSFTQRDLYERSFGVVVLAIFAVAALESLPWALEYFHDRIQLGEFGWPGGLGIVATAIAVFSGADKLLSALGGLKKKFAMVLIGVLGLLVPLIVILFAADFLVYGLPPSPWVMYSPLLVPVAGVIGIGLVAIPLGLWRHAFTRTEFLAVAGLLVVATALVVTVVSAGQMARTETEQSLAALDQKLVHYQLFASEFESVSNTHEMAPEVATLVGNFIDAHRNFESEREAIGTLEQNLKKKTLDQFTKLCEDKESNEKIRESLVNWYERPGDSSKNMWICLKYDLAKADWDKRYFSSKLPFLVLGHRLSELPDRELEPLRGEISRRAYDQLLELINQKNSDGRIDELILRTLVERYLSPVPWKKSPNGAEPAKVRKNFKTLIDDRDVKNGTEFARDAVQEAAVTKIALLVDQQKLFRAVAKKFEEGKAETAKLAGKDGLAKLLTSEEILDLAFKQYDSNNFVTRLHRNWLVENSLPSFPSNPDDKEYKEETLEIARALAGLVDLTLASEESAQTSEESTQASAEPDDSLALYYATPEGSSARRPDDEFARAAGVRLARRALHRLDAHHLQLLSFNLANPVEMNEEDLRDFRNRREELKNDKDLQEFLAELNRPLTYLVEEAFPLSRVEAPEANETSKDELYLWPAVHRYPLLMAAKALGNETDEIARLARLELLARALGPNTKATSDEVTEIIDEFGRHPAKLLGVDELARIAITRLWSSEHADELISKVMFAKFARLEPGKLGDMKKQFSEAVMPPNVIFISILAVVIWLGCWLTVDVNLTSVHGLYRDRLAAAFLIGKDTKGDIRVEEDIDLDDICLYDARSIAPYHLINVALNLQGSKDINVRDRKSDFFIFSKRFIGGPHTGYCRSESMEQVFPEMSVATAMAISAAAASPNMGRATSPLLVAFMTLLNIRLGFWTPNPGLLEERLRRRRWKPETENRQRAAKPGFSFEEVFAAELQEIGRRWDQVYPDSTRRRDNGQENNTKPSVDRQLFGIGFSGGGIRSAAINLGISQALSKCGVFDHLDYMSTVSGGGYLGSSLSTLMRSREKLCSEIAGTVSIKAKDEQTVIVKPSGASETPRIYRFAGHAKLNVRDGECIPAGKPLLKPRTAMRQSDIAGTVTVDNASSSGPVVRIAGTNECREYRFSRFDSVAVGTGDTVKAGQDLIRRHDTFGERFSWRVRPLAFVREMLSKLDEKRRWVNVSDGGHIENLATIELLRRRCKYIIIGDGEADPNLHFNGLATLIRCARIDLGIHIDIDLDPIRLRKSTKRDDEGAVSAAHWALGTITYPARDGNGQLEIGYLLYLKSSFTGEEDEAIREYRNRNPTFPHQSTADQFFDEDQFEAYRALGQHIAEGALKAATGVLPAGKMSFSDVSDWFAQLQGKKEGQA